MGIIQIHQENCEDILCPCREGARNSKGWKELTKHNSTGKAIIRDGIYLPSLWKNKQKLQLWLEDFIEYQFLKLLGHIQNMRVNSLYYLYAFFYFWSFEIEGIKNYVKCIYLIKEQVTAYRRNIDENKINFYLLIVETYFSQYIENIICQNDKSLEYSNKITDINNAILIRMFGSLVINEFALEDLKQQLIKVLSKKQDIYYKLTNGYISYTEFQQDLIYLVKASRKIEKQIYKNLQTGGENIHYYKILQLIKLIIFNDLVSVQAVDRKLQDLILKDSKEDELLVHSISILKGNVTSLLMNYKEYTCSVIGYSSNSPGFFGYEKNEFKQLKNINFTLPECLAYYHDSLVGRLIREGNSHILRKYRVLVSRTKDNFIFPCKIYVDYFFHITNQLCFSGTILKIQNSYQYMIVSQDGWIQDISEGLIDTLKQYANIDDIDTEIFKQANIKALFPQLLEFLENYEANQIQPNTNHIFSMVIPQKLQELLAELIHQKHKFIEINAQEIYNDKLLFAKKLIFYLFKSCQHLYESYCTVIDVHIRITKEHLEVDHQGLKQDLKMFILEMNQFTIVDQFYSKDQENLYFEKELNALQSDIGMVEEFNLNQDKLEQPQNLNISVNNDFNFQDYPQNNNNNNNQYKIEENQKILSLDDPNESYNIQLNDELKQKINKLTYDEKKALSQILDKLTANNLIFQESLNDKNELLIKQQLNIDQNDNSLGIEKEVEKFTDIIDQIKKQNFGFDQVQKYIQQKQDQNLLKANTPLSPFQRKQTAELTDNKNKQNLNKQVSKMSQSINNSQSVLQKLLTMGTAFTQKSQKTKKKSIYEVKTKIKTLMVLTKMVGKKALGGIGEMVEGQDKQNNKKSLMKTLAHNNGDKHNKNQLQIPETLAIRRDKKFNLDDEKNEDSQMIISDLEAIQMVEEQNLSSEDDMPGDLKLNKQDVDQQVFLEEDEEEKEDWEKFINSNNYLDLVKQVLQQLGEYEQSYYDKGFQKEKSKREKPGMSVYDQSIFEAQKMGDSDTSSQESIGSSDVDMRDIQQVDAMNNVKFDQGIILLTTNFKLIYNIISDQKIPIFIVNLFLIMFIQFLLYTGMMIFEVTNSQKSFKSIQQSLDVFSFNTYYSSQMSRINIGQNNLILENYGIYDYVDESLLNAQNKFLLNQNEQAYQNFKNQLYSQLSTPIYYPVQEYFFDKTDTFRNWNSTFQTYNKITDRYLSENMKIIQQEMYLINIEKNYDIQNYPYTLSINSKTLYDIFSKMNNMTLNDLELSRTFSEYLFMILTILIVILTSILMFWQLSRIKNKQERLVHLLGRISQEDVSLEQKKIYASIKLLETENCSYLHVDYRNAEYMVEKFCEDYEINQFSTKKKGRTSQNMLSERIQQKYISYNFQIFLLCLIFILQISSIIIGFVFSSDYISGFGSQLENEQEFVQAIIDYSYLIQCTDNINFKNLIQNEQTVFSDDIYTEFLDIQEQTLEDVRNYFTYQYQNLQNSKQSTDFKEKVVEINQGNNCEREFLNELEQQSCKNSAKKIADQGFQVTLTHILNGITGEIQSELKDYNDYKTYIEVSDQQEEIQVQLIMMKIMQTIYDYFNDDNNSLLNQKQMIIWLLYIGFITVYIVLLIFVCFEFLNLFVFKFPYLKYALLTMPLQRLREGNNTLTLIKNIFAST